MSPQGANILFNWHYKKLEIEPCEHNNLSPKLKSFLHKEIDFSLPEISKSFQAHDGTQKFLIKFHDGRQVESVLIPFQQGKMTACISSQVGCGMNCSFCYTGTQGLQRQLKTHEIVGQLLVMKKWLKKNDSNKKVSNVVFMGQGEPLHNFDNVKKALKIFINQAGLSIGWDKITVSTVGFLPGLKRWPTELPPINMALSLHSTDSSRRNQLIPINERFPLDEVLKVFFENPPEKKRFHTIEYLLIKNFNDTEEEISNLVKYFREGSFIINVIPFNPFPGSQYERPSDLEVGEFHKELEKRGLMAFVRKTKGDDILAACGQLVSEKNHLHFERSPIKT